MMNGYSKIGGSTAATTTTTSHKSRSIDFSEFFSFPAPPQTSRTRRNSTTHLPQTPLDQPPSNHIIQDEQPNINDNQTQNQNGGKGERFGVILGRSCSVSASSPSLSSGFQATMKRAFSVTRSSSVTDRYCRIHDQSMAIASDDDNDDINIDDAPKNKTNRSRGTKRGKILKACKRLFGL